MHTLKSEVLIPNGFTHRNYSIGKAGKHEEESISGIGGNSNVIVTDCMRKLVKDARR